MSKTKKTEKPDFTPDGLRYRWSKAFTPLLGKKIVGIRWMSNKEAKEMDWNGLAIVLTLDDGTLLYPSMDDAGALFVQASNKLVRLKVPAIAPVIH